MIAPRPVLVIEPQLDRDATPADVQDAVDQARKVYTLYGAGDKLTLKSRGITTGCRRTRWWMRFSG